MKVNVSGYVDVPGCYVNYSEIYSRAPPRLQSAVNNRISHFSSVINSSLGTYLSRLDSASNDTTTFDSKVDSIITSFESMIGDQSNGMIGEFIKLVNDDVSAVSNSLKNEIGTCAPLPSTNPSNLSSNLSNAIQSIVSSSYSSMSSIVSTVRTSFYNHVIKVSSDVLDKRLLQMSSKYKTSVDSDISKASNSLQSILSSHVSQLRALDEFSSDVDNKVQEISNKFSVACSTAVNTLNSAITTGSNSFSSDLSTIKYAGADASAKVTAAYEDVNNYASDKSKSFVSSYESVLNEFNSELGTFATSAFSARRSNLFNVAKSVIGNQIDEDIRDVSATKRQIDGGIDRVIDSVRDFLVGSSPPTFIDSTSIRNFRSVTRNDAIDLANKLMSSAMSDFSSKTSMVEGRQVDRINSSMNKFNSDLQQLYVAGASTDDLDDFIDQVSEFVASKRADFTNNVALFSNSLIDKLLDTRRLVTKYVDDVLSSFPVIRLIGSASFPNSIVVGGVTPITFEIANVGGSTWSGWFGVKAVDENVKEYYHNYKPISPIVIPAGGTKKVTVEVPFHQYFGDKPPQSLNIKLVANTYTSGVMLSPKQLMM